MDPDFDEFLHAWHGCRSSRLLAPADRVDFGFLRDTIGTSDSALSKHLSALVGAGYVSVRKNPRPRSSAYSSGPRPERAAGVPAARGRARTNRRHRPHATRATWHMNPPAAPKP